MKLPNFPINEFFFDRINMINRIGMPEGEAIRHSELAEGSVRLGKRTAPPLGTTAGNLP
jgi:hypothetical protein